MKRVILTLAAICIFIFGIGLAACGEDADDQTPKTFSITAESGNGYTVDAPDSAEPGTEVTVTVTLTNGDSYIIGVTYNGQNCELNGEVYRFTMPEEMVTIAVQTGTYTEVLTDGMATFSAENLTRTIAQNSYNGAVWDTNLWDFYIDIDASNTFALSDKSEVTSSDQSVIPDSALTVETVKDSGSGLVTSAKVRVDTGKIQPGSTWLRMYFKSGNTSKEGTLMIKITVVPYGKVEVTTAKKTLVIDVSDLGAAEGDSYMVRFSDRNYIDGGTAANYFDVTGTVKDGKVAFEFNYALLHKYSIGLVSGTVYDYEKVIPVENRVIGDGTAELYNGYTSAGLMFWTADEIELKALAD